MTSFFASDKNFVKTQFDFCNLTSSVTVYSEEPSVRALEKLIFIKDSWTHAHSVRVVRRMRTFINRLRKKENVLKEIDNQVVDWGVLLHDVGKVGIPDSILLKKGKLTARERRVMNRHVVYSRDILQELFTKIISDIGYYHHERWDGTGYPCGLKGNKIPLLVRMFSIVDVWDAITSKRVYAPAEPPEKALAYIKSMSGKAFDPDLVDIFTQLDMHV